MRKSPVGLVLAAAVAVGLVVVRPGLAAASELAQAVFITDDASHPVPTAAQDVTAVSGSGNVAADRPTPVPVVEPITLDLNDSCSSDGDTYTVPAGKRLVLEDVVGRAFMPAGERRFSSVLSGGPAGFHSYPLTATFDGTQSANDFYVVNGLSRAYAEPGAVIQPLISNCGTSGTLSLTASGYLTDA